MYYYLNAFPSWAVKYQGQVGPKSDPYILYLGFANGSSRELNMEIKRLFITKHCSDVTK